VVTSIISVGAQQQRSDKPQGRLPRTPDVTAHELMFKPLDAKSGLSSAMNSLLFAKELSEQIVTAGKSISLRCFVLITVLMGRLMYLLKAL